MHASIVYQTKRSLAMFGGGRSTPSTFRLLSISIDRGLGDARMPRRFLLPRQDFVLLVRLLLSPPLSAITYRRIITARALSRWLSRIYTHDRDDRASAVREIEYLPPRM